MLVQSFACSEHVELETAINGTECRSEASTVALPSEGPLIATLWTTEFTVDEENPTALTVGARPPDRDIRNLCHCNECSLYLHELLLGLRQPLGGRSSRMLLTLTPP
ncbi:hypothetical protein [Natrialba asiatica]|uniref:Uncharacterized protein n=1 Tax=Natrialba asiatica (strain ATCC 700177 / DSM 12278 / JCM 9576 / FERM P-10747 / NBRC 102637 / 172P1) TaxID=29540 RepID=M0AVV4_NATA1|nr:hypothetical protein [Natrialba asiatica]ELZ02675.1 hypothetical protein C481_08406 [Natrialba asiatica DSM 12278]